MNLKIVDYNKNNFEVKSLVSEVPCLGYESLCISVYICSWASSNVLGVGSTMFLLTISLTRESSDTWR